VHPYPIFEPNILDYLNGTFWLILIIWLILKLYKKLLK